MSNKQNVQFYWLPHCTTCQKAIRFLESHNVAFQTLRDIKSDKLSRDEVEKLAAKCGDTDKMFSKRAIKYRELKLNERELSNEEMINLMAEEYTFIKRPVLLVGEKVIIGFNRESYIDILL